MVVCIVYSTLRVARNEKVSMSPGVSMTPDTLEPTDTRVADERDAAWSSAGGAPPPLADDGPQDGNQSSAELFVRRVTPEPSAFIAYISMFPSLSELNAMRRPSGAQDGPQSGAELFVRRATPEPSAFITYISVFPPSLPESNAMRRPSGDQDGL